MNNSTILRAPRDAENPWRMINRHAMEDERMSFEARGALAFILVKPDDWQVNVTNLMREGGIGRDKAYRIINEWIKAGYCKRVEHREKGVITGYTYYIHESPLSVEEAMPLTGKPEAAEPEAAEPFTANTDHSNKEVFTKKEERAAQAPTPPAHRPYVAADSYDMVLPTTTPPSLQKAYAPSQSRHVPDPRKFRGGHIPAGTGATAVEVYYESFSVNEKEERLTEPNMDDLAKTCPDLPKLRSVCVAYSRTAYRRRNLALILDWYTKGIPGGKTTESAPGAWKNIKNDVPDYMKRMLES